MCRRREITISTKMIHLNAKIISRGGEKPQSAVASAAYRSATKIYCEYDGEIKDFSRKGHVIYSEILLPEYAPKEFADRSVLWNAVENFEKGSRAQLSREVEFSLPCELDADERLKAARTLAEFFRDKGMVVDMNLHSPDHENPNPHCHLMLTMRPFQKDGNMTLIKTVRKSPQRKEMIISHIRFTLLIGTTGETWKNGVHCGQILKLNFIRRTAMRLQRNTVLLKDRE